MRDSSFVLLTVCQDRVNTHGTNFEPGHKRVESHKLVSQYHLNNFVFNSSL